MLYHCSFLTRPQNFIIFLGFAANRAKVPVMVFIHGGAFMFYHASSVNASKLASSGSVVVAFNYRLGALGFLAADKLERKQISIPAGLLSTKFSHLMFPCASKSGHS
jgi:hypothetical protein